MYQPTELQVLDLAQNLLTGEISAGAVWDHYNDFGLMDSVSFGAGWLGVGVSGFYAVFDTDKIDNLTGASFEMGASAGAGLGVGYDYFYSLDGVGYGGRIYSAGFSVGVPAEAHSQISFTRVQSLGLKVILRRLIGISLIPVIREGIEASIFGL